SSRGPAARATSFSSRGPMPGRLRVSAKRGKRIEGRMGANLSEPAPVRPLAEWRPARYIRRMAIASSNGGSSEARRKRLLFRAQRRGFKEVDLIFGTFAADALSRMNEAELDQFEALLEAPDHEVY